jgi:hypothetical protein
MFLDLCDRRLTPLGSHPADLYRPQWYPPIKLCALHRARDLVCASA